MCVCVVPQLSVPAAEPAPGLPEDHHLPEGHFSQRGRLQRQGEFLGTHTTELWLRRHFKDVPMVETRAQTGRKLTAALIVWPSSENGRS